MTRFRRALPPLLLGCLGLLLAFQPILLTGFGQIPGDPGDARFEHYILEHGHAWLTGRKGFPDFWNAAFFHPAPRTVAYSDPLLALVAHYSLFRLLGFLPDTAFQLWQLLLGALNFVVAVLFLRGPLALSPWAASAGAFVFAFGAPRLSHNNHPQLLASFFCLTAVHALVRAFQAHARGARAHPPTSLGASGTGPSPAAWLAVCFASLVCQLYSTITHGWFIGVALGLALLWALALPSLRPGLMGFVRSHWRAIVVGGAVSAVALVPLGKVYLETAREVGFRSLEESWGTLPRFASWLNLGEGSWLYGWTAGRFGFQYLPMEHEQRLGLGLVTTVLVAVVLWRQRRQPLFLLSALTLVTLFLLTLKFRGDFTPWRFVHAWVPGGNGIRAVARVGFLTLIPAALAVGWAVDRWRVVGLGGVLGVLCLLEQGQRVDGYDAAPYRAFHAETARAVPTSGCDAFFAVPSTAARPALETQIDAMFAQLETGVPTVNGYSGNFPPGWRPLLEHAAPDDASLARIQAALASWEARHPGKAGRVCLVRVP